MGKERKDMSKWRVAIIGIGFVIGAALLLFGGGGDKSEEVVRDTATAYRAELEEGLESLCERLTGGEVEVFVSLESGFSYSYALDSRGGVVTVGSGSSEKALVEKELAPSVSGVGVVCSSALSAEREKELMELVSSALGIGKNKIFIIGAKKTVNKS